MSDTDYEDELDSETPEDRERAIVRAWLIEHGLLSIMDGQPPEDSQSYTSMARKYANGEMSRSDFIKAREKEGL